MAVVWQPNIIYLVHRLQDVQLKYDERLNFLCYSWTELKDFLGNRANFSLLENHIKNLIGCSTYMVLDPEWKNVKSAHKNHLKTRIIGCGEVLNANFLRQYQSLVALLQSDPWGDDVLTNVFQDRPYSSHAALRFLEADQFVLKLRLTILCEKKCRFHLAQKLAGFILEQYWGNRKDTSLYFEEEHLHYFHDVYLVLLMRSKKGSRNNIDEKAMKLLNELSFEEGNKLLQRLKHYQYHPPDKSKVWKRSHQATEAVSMFFTAKAMKGTKALSDEIRRNFITDWIDIFRSDEEFPDAIRKLSASAISGEHKFLMCDILQAKYCQDFRNNCIELYIGGFTMEINKRDELLRLKNEAEASALEERLSAEFFKLADLLSNLELQRECILIAFCLNPNDRNFERVHEMAVLSGKCERNIPISGEEEVTKASLENGYMEPDISSVNEYVNLDIPQHLIDDLNIIFDFSRTRALHWQLEWPDLKIRCEEHMVSVKKGDHRKAKELNFLTLDYNELKSLPIAEDANHSGIEKGFETNYCGSEVTSQKNISKLSNFQYKLPSRVLNPFFNDTFDFQEVTAEILFKLREFDKKLSAYIPIDED